MKIFVTARFDQDELKKLAETGAQIEQAGFGITGQKLDEDELVLKLADVDIAIIEFENITDKVLTAAKKLKYLACLRNEPDRKSTRLNSSHVALSRMPSSA